MATFGEFTVARLGMVASQLGLNITGQNISNINTTGYTRQRLDQYSFVTNGAGLYRPTNPASVGQGVLVSGVSQLRDPYLDIRFRKEMSGVASADATLSGLEQIVSVLDDVEKAGGITPALQALRDKFAALSSDKVNEQEFDTLVRSAAQELCQILNLSATKLEEAYNNVMESYKTDVKGVNETLQKIQDLTEQIRIADINGDPALELRDSRNQMIDDLSQYMKIDVVYGKEQVAPGFEVEKLTIKMVDNETGKPGAMLIDGISRADITLDETDPQLRLTIGELTDPDGIQTSNTNSRFQLGGLAFDKNAIPGTAQQTITISYTDADGKAQTANLTFDVTVPTANADEAAIAQAKADTLKSLQKAMEQDVNLSKLFKIDATSSGFKFTSTDVGAKAAEITNVDYRTSGISFGSQKHVEAADSNVTTIEEGMGYGALESTRQILTSAGEFSTDGTGTDTRGIPYYQKSLDMLANKLATELNRINTTGPDGQPLQNADGTPNPHAGNLFVAEDDPDGDTLITAANIAISDKWSSGETKVVAAITNDPDSQTTMNDNLSRFVDAFTKEMTYNPLQVVRQNGTMYESGELTQDAAVQDGTNLSVKITYLDSMNQERTVTVDFKAGANANDTAQNMLAALQGDPTLGAAGFTNFGFDGNKISLGATNGDDDTLCNLVTNLEIVDPNTGKPAEDMGVGKGSYSLNGESVSFGNLYTGSFEGCYTNTEAILGTAYSTTNTIYNTYATQADTLNNSRDGVAGVDLNEEGINMMTYQKAFAAACRLMTALDEAMETVINGMGVVGR